MSGRMRMLLCAVLIALVVSQTDAASPPEGSGERLYARHCAACHDNAVTRAPPRDALARLSPRRILRTMDFGLMMSVAYALRRDERDAVAQFLGQGADDPPVPEAARCKSPDVGTPANASAAWTSWSPAADNTRYQDAGGAGLRADQLPQLRLKWAFGFPGDVIAFGAPTVHRGRLYVGSAGGTVYALDARTGCIHWAYEADGPVRTPPTVVEDGSSLRLLFTDQTGGVYALQARDGSLAWKTRVEAHEATRLSGAIVVHQGLAYVPAASWEETRSVDPAYPCCSFRGSVSALRVADGSVAWKTWLVDEPRKTGVSAAGSDLLGPSGVGVWSAPTIDAKRGLLYVATGDNYTHPATSMSDAIVALALDTGRIAWTQQTTPGDVFNATCPRGLTANCGPDHDFAASAMLVKTAGGREVLVAGQKSGVAYGLDPDAKGRLLWQQRVGQGGTAGGIQWGMASDGQLAYAAVADAVRTAGDPSSPQVGYAPFDPAKGGGLTAIDVLSGERRWFAAPAPCAPVRDGCSPAKPGAVTAIPGAVLSGSMDGHLRAFSSVDGRVLWDIDTGRSYDTVNGVPARGGSLDGAGPVVVDGWVYVNSGYPRLGGVPGNVLLAFGLDDSSRP